MDGQPPSWLAWFAVALPVATVSEWPACSPSRLLAAPPVLLVPGASPLPERARLCARRQLHLLGPAAGRVPALDQDHRSEAPQGLYRPNQLHAGELRRVACVLLLHWWLGWPLQRLLLQQQQGAAEGPQGTATWPAAYCGVLPLRLRCMSSWCLWSQWACGALTQRWKSEWAPRPLPAPASPCPCPHAHTA